MALKRGEVIRILPAPEAPAETLWNNCSCCEEDYLVLKPMHSAFYQSHSVSCFGIWRVLPILAGWRPTAALSAPRTTPICGTWGCLCPFDCSASRSRLEHHKP